VRDRSIKPYHDSGAREASTAGRVKAKEVEHVLHTSGYRLVTVRVHRAR
jgi:hypothetical protein